MTIIDGAQIRSDATINLFGSFTLTNNSDSLGATISFKAANGVLSGFGLSSGVTSGSTVTYTLSATAPATLQSKLQALLFTPTIGLTATTQFTLNVSSPTPLTLSSGVNTPYSVTVDSSGDVFVANQGNNTVEEFSATGTLLLTLSGSNGINSPYSVAVDSAGDVFVANYGNSTVEEFSSKGVWITTLSSGVSDPASVAIDSSGDVFVANLNNGNNATVEKFSPSGTLAWTLSSSNGINSPYSVAVDSTGDVVVANGGSSTVEEFSSGGALQWTQSMNSPVSVAVDSVGDVFVANLENSTVVEFSSSGALVNTLSSGVSYPQSVSVDSAGDVFVANASGTVTEFSSIGALMRTMSGGLGTNLRSVAVDSSGDVFVANTNFNNVKEFSAIASTTTSVTTTAVSPPPAITGVAYDPNTGNLTLTGTNFTISTSDYALANFTLTGNGGGSYTLGKGDTITSATAATVVIQIASTNQASADALLNRNGTTSAATGGNAFNLSAAAGWDTSAALAATTNAITVASTGAPSLSHSSTTSPAAPTAGGTVVVIDNGTITVADHPDNGGKGYWNGGTLVVNIVSGADTNHDTLSIAGTVTTTTGIITSGSTAGSSVRYNGTQIGTIASGSTGAPGSALQINLNGNATDAALQALVSAISFSDSVATAAQTATAAAATAGTRTVNFTLTDAYGQSSTALTDTVNVTPSVVVNAGSATLITPSTGNSNATDTTRGFHVLNILTIVDSYANYTVSSNQIGVVNLTNINTQKTISLQLTATLNGANNSGDILEFLDGAMAATSNVSNGNQTLWLTRSDLGTQAWGVNSVAITAHPEALTALGAAGSNTVNSTLSSSSVAALTTGIISSNLNSVTGNVYATAGTNTIYTNVAQGNAVNFIVAADASIMITNPSYTTDAATGTHMLENIQVNGNSTSYTVSSSYGLVTLANAGNGQKISFQMTSPAGSANSSIVNVQFTDGSVGFYSSLGSSGLASWRIGVGTGGSSGVTDASATASTAAKTLSTMGVPVNATQAYKPPPPPPPSPSPSPTMTLTAASDVIALNGATGTITLQGADLAAYPVGAYGTVALAKAAGITTVASSGAATTILNVSGNTAATSYNFTTGVVSGADTVDTRLTYTGIAAYVASSFGDTITTPTLNAIVTLSGGTNTFAGTQNVAQLVNVTGTAGLTATLVNGHTGVVTVAVTATAGTYSLVNLVTTDMVGVAQAGSITLNLNNVQITGGGGVIAGGGGTTTLTNVAANQAFGLTGATLDDTDATDATGGHVFTLNAGPNTVKINGAGITTIFAKGASNDTLTNVQGSTLIWIGDNSTVTTDGADANISVLSGTNNTLTTGGASSIAILNGAAVTTFNLSSATTFTGTPNSADIIRISGNGTFTVDLGAALVATTSAITATGGNTVTFIDAAATQAFTLTGSSIDLSAANDTTNYTIGMTSGTNSATVKAGDLSTININGGTDTLAAAGAIGNQSITVTGGALTLGAYEYGLTGLSVTGTSTLDLGAVAGTVHAAGDTVTITSGTDGLSNSVHDTIKVNGGATTLGNAGGADSIMLVNSTGSAITGSVSIALGTHTTFDTVFVQGGASTTATTANAATGFVAGTDGINIGATVQTNVAVQDTITGGHTYTASTHGILFDTAANISNGGTGLTFTTSIDNYAIATDSGAILYSDNGTFATGHSIQVGIVAVNGTFAGNVIHIA
jgi:hypothetical protein